MPNRFVETSGFILLLFAIFGIFAVLFPVTAGQSFTVLYAYIVPVVAIIFSYAIFYFYAQRRNRRFARRLSQYVSCNDYQSALELLNQAIDGHPKTVWLQVERAIIVGLSGEMERFYALFAVLHDNKAFFKQHNCWRLIVQNDVFDLLATGCYPGTVNEKMKEKQSDRYLSIDSLLLHKTAQAYVDRDFKNVISAASTLYDMKPYFYTYFSAVILSKSYNETHDDEKSLFYKTAYSSNPLFVKLNGIQIGVASAS